MSLKMMLDFGNFEDELDFDDFECDVGTLKIVKMTLEFSWL